jgi:hypothetical protein
MFLKEGSASLLVNSKSVSLIDALDSVLEHLLFALFNRLLEEVLVPIKRELIHRINLVKVIEHEE